jgi:hypothetical protein
MRANDSDQLVLQNRLSGDRFVNPRGERHDIGVARADQDAGMRSPLPMNADEVAAVEGEDGTPSCRGRDEDRLIRCLPVTEPIFLCRQDVMAETAQFGNHARAEVFVGVEACHLIQASASSRIASSISSRC